MNKLAPKLTVISVASGRCGLLNLCTKTADIQNFKFRPKIFLVQKSLIINKWNFFQLKESLTITWILMGTSSIIDTIWPNLEAQAHRIYISTLKNHTCSIKYKFYFLFKVCRVYSSSQPPVALYIYCTYFGNWY